jgi:hypothetical protein
LFNNCGICDQYVITIGVDRKCEGYVETVYNNIFEQKPIKFHLCDVKCKYWQLDSYNEWVCGCTADDFNPHGYCTHYDDGGKE